MTTHEKALEAVAVKVSEITGCLIDREDASEIMAQYLSALTPPDVAGLVAEAITGHFGERCPDYAEGCACCEAWVAHDRLTHLAAENALLRERDGWKPIETAPEGKGGYSWMLLAYGDREDPSVSTGFRFGSKFYAASTFYRGGAHDTRQYELREQEVSPFAWMPSPASPSHQEQSNG